jgi:hypothetical protein
MLLALCIGLTVFAGPAYGYMEAAIRALPGSSQAPAGPRQ